MSTQAYADRLAKAVVSTGLAESINNTFSPDRVSILLRVKQGVDAKWIEVVKNILIATDTHSKDAHAWHAHICRTYFLKPGKVLVFGWSITVTSQDLTHALDDIVKVVMGGSPEPVTVPVGEIEEFPLIGASANRNVPGESGKGAHTIGGKGKDFRVFR